MQTLTTSIEVLNNSPAGRDYPTTHICEVLPNIEETIWNRCFGDTFFDYMVEHLTDIPNPDEWDDCKIYSDGDFVIRDTRIYESQVNLNRSDPLEDSTKWSLIKKFDTDCLNTLWERYLVKVIALRAYAGSLLYTTHNTGAGGLTIRSDDANRGGSGTRSANKAELILTETKTLKDAQEIYENMVVWLKKNRTTTCDFPAIKLFDEDCGPDCSPKKGRRIAFRR